MVEALLDVVAIHRPSTSYTWVGRHRSGNGQLTTICRTVRSSTEKSTAGEGDIRAGVSSNRWPFFIASETAFPWDDLGYADRTEYCTAMAGDGEWKIDD